MQSMPSGSKDVMSKIKNLSISEHKKRAKNYLKVSRENPQLSAAEAMALSMEDPAQSQARPRRLQPLEHPSHPTQVPAMQA